MPSAKLLRNSSMAPLNSTGLHSLNFENHSNDASSPLKLFKQAKQSMNSVYQDFNFIIYEIKTFLECKYIFVNNFQLSITINN